MLGKLALGALFAAVAIQGHAAAAKSPPPDGTLVRGVGGGQAEVALMVGGARLPLTGPAELAQAQRGGTKVKTLSLPAYQALPQQIADGTFLTAPGSGPTWVVTGGRRAVVPVDQIPLKHVQVVPAGALERIPVVRRGR